MWRERKERRRFSGPWSFVAKEESKEERGFPEKVCVAQEVSKECAQECVSTLYEKNALACLLFLDRVKDGHIKGLSRHDFRPLVRSRALSMELQKLSKIKLGSLENLYFSDEDILERVNPLTGLFDFLSNDFRNEFLDQFLQVARGRFLGNNLKHFLSNGPNLSRGGVGSLSELVLSSLSESNEEDAEEVPIGRLDILVALNEGLFVLHG